MLLNSIFSMCAMSAALAGMDAQALQAPAPKPPPRVVAGIPANYDEAKVGSYTLPEPLKLNNGKPVRDAKTWYGKRRPEIVEMFETQQYGRAPGKPADESFEVHVDPEAVLNGRALRKQVIIRFSKDESWPKIHLVMYVRRDAHGPVPMLLNISFGPASSTVDDSGLPPGEVWDSKTNTRIPAPKGRGFGHLEVERLIDAGFGVATFYYGDVDPDYANGFSNGIRAHYLKPGQTERAPDEWGSIAAWAWGMSRVMDYFEHDSSVDAKRVAIHGVSRLGKTVMWAGAHDERFALVIASCSGEGGAALSRRNYGETIAHLVAPGRFPYQFAINYQKYAQHVDDMPMDAHMLVALIAPRPLLLQTGSTDYWSDPKGEFLAAVNAGPVYKLLGKEGLNTGVWPAAKEPILHDIGYYMHDGGHGVIPSDWDIYIQFLKMHLQPGK
jgi:hypothetical protein